MDEDDAREALAALQTSRERLAGQARWSLARHASVGAVLGILIASYALPMLLQVGTFVLCILVLRWIIVRDRKRDGFFVNGYRPGKTRIVAIAMAVVAVSVLLLALASARLLGLWWAPLVLGALMLPVATLMSLWWERVYRRELAGRE
jgi:hypothetical protein